MSIIEAARRHFGPRWKIDIRVLGRDAFRLKIAELEKEIAELQRSCERLRRADQREPQRGRVEGSDIHILSDRVEAELATLHGWAVSLVETVFVLVGMETDEETELREAWKLNL